MLVEIPIVNGLPTGVRTSPETSADKASNASIRQNGENAIRQCRPWPFVARDLNVKDPS
ncbi:hypothetical protein AN958_00972 [Leucoagaricus sp. SymC.cos]|nr:hypothetical protein AN958_00972 [Leucoagaricus sp. SymC.cos]